jgi:ABC-type uncharacterized transport system permease subunit
MTINFLTNWLAACPLYATPLLLAILGLLLSERAGVMNLGAEGIITVGALAGVAGSIVTGSTWLGLAGALAAGMLLAFVYALIVVVLRANQVVSGLALVAMGVGIAGVLGTSYAQRPVPGLHPLDLGALARVPLVGDMLFRQDPVVYLALLLAFGVSYGLFRSRIGLNLRAVGHNPAAADAAGVSVVTYRIVAIVAGGALLGLAGGYLSAVSSRVWVEGMVGGRGWIAVALVIFARWMPGRAIAGAFIFGGIDALIPRIQATGASVPIYLFFMLPYAVTLAGLMLAALRSERFDAPASLGRPFVREDRH